MSLPLVSHLELRFTGLQGLCGRCDCFSDHSGTVRGPGSGFLADLCSHSVLSSSLCDWVSQFAFAQFVLLSDLSLRSRGCSGQVQQQQQQQSHSSAASTNVTSTKCVPMQVNSSRGRVACRTARSPYGHCILRWLCLALLLNPVVDVVLFPKRKPQLNTTMTLAPLVEYAPLKTPSF